MGKDEAEMRGEIEERSVNDARHYDDDRSDYGSFGCAAGKINHVEVVNGARYVIATKTVSAEVDLFDYSKHPYEPPWDGACCPGLSSDCDDDPICLGDINATPKNKALEAMRIFKDLVGFSEDVAWHLRHEYVFGSFGDHQYLLRVDLHTPSVTKPVLSVVAHQSEVNCLSFNAFKEPILPTVSTDKTVKLFDLRKINTAIHAFDGHKEEVFQVGWNAKNETILASCCLGRRLTVWNLSRIDEEQTQEDAEDDPSELLFTYGSHRSKLSDFSWNPSEDWVTGENFISGDCFEDSEDEEADSLSMEEDGIHFPPKMEDQGIPILDISVGNNIKEQAVVDCGASVNVLPYPVYKRWKLKGMHLSVERCQLANNTVTCSLGEVKDIHVKVGTLTIGADFIIMDMGDKEASILLGRPFLITGRAKINMEEGLLTMTAQDKTVNFHVFKPLRYPVKAGEASNSISGNVIT